MLERLLTYSLPDSVRELQHAAFELGSMSDVRSIWLDDGVKRRTAWLSCDCHFPDLVPRSATAGKAFLPLIELTRPQETSRALW